MAIKDLRHRCNFLSIQGIRSGFSHGGELGSTKL